MLTEAYRAVMDEDVNALNALPRTVRFQLMTVLAFMWSAIFTIWVGATWTLGPTLAAHMLLLFGVVFTANIFRQTQQRSVRCAGASGDPRDRRARRTDARGKA